ncbi:PAQR family membrane homeostasis protein TrhA [Aeromonas hydrophila]|uniref:PAQR family membrane homeostasis protein TrhA n=1 Tax=Aeromonas hydrophila TaxID=644 RepID=UPI000AD41C6C|nr:hemolysin III family protein [Aeromonas hydrophila]
MSAVWAGVCNEQCDGLFAREELANRLSHGLGLVLGILGLVLLLNKGWAQGLRRWSVTASMVQPGAALLGLDPLPQHGGRAGQTLVQGIRHCAIYLLIAGTYTPFLLVALDTPLAQGLMVVIWGWRWRGWCSSCLHQPFQEAVAVYLPDAGLAVVAGGLSALHPSGGGKACCCSGWVVSSTAWGVIFYVAKRIPYNHAIWHLFVLGGSVCHFMAIYGYVA